MCSAHIFEAFVVLLLRMRECACPYVYICECACVQGWITWHAFPFNAEPEVTVIAFHLLAPNVVPSNTLKHIEPDVFMCSLE